MDWELLGKIGLFILMIIGFMWGFYCTMATGFHRQGYQKDKKDGKWEYKGWD
jgi:hypothetical protein